MAQECPVCYTEFSQTVIDGKDNSDSAEVCKHYLCVPCCQTLYNNLRKEFKKGGWGKKGKTPDVKCPICREDWTEWILSHYNDEEEEDTN